MDSPFAKLKVTELKEQLAAKGLSTKGLKRDLVERLEVAASTETDGAIEYQGQEYDQEYNQEYNQECNKECNKECNEECNEESTHISQNGSFEELVSSSNNNNDDDGQHELADAKLVEPEYNEQLDYEDSNNGDVVVIHQSSDIDLGIAGHVDKVKKVASIENVPPQPTPKQESSIVKISNFVRPFTIDSVQALLGHYGLITTFWMDRLRSMAFVEYDSVEAAQMCKFHVDGLQWPERIGRQLSVEFSNAELMNAAMNAPTMVIENPLPPPESVPEKRDTFNNVTKTLDELFCRTKSRPHIYYLPKRDQ